MTLNLDNVAAGSFTGGFAGRRVWSGVSPEVFAMSDGLAMGLQGCIARRNPRCDVMTSSGGSLLLVLIPCTCRMSYLSDAVFIAVV